MCLSKRCSQVSVAGWHVCICGHKGWQEHIGYGKPFPSALMLVPVDLELQQWFLRSHSYLTSVYISCGGGWMCLLDPGLVDGSWSGMVPQEWWGELFLQDVRYGHCDSKGLTLEGNCQEFHRSKDNCWESCFFVHLLHPPLHFSLCQDKDRDPKHKSPQSPPSLVVSLAHMCTWLVSWCACSGNITSSIIITPLHLSQIRRGVKNWLYNDTYFKFSCGATLIVFFFS